MMTPIFAALALLAAPITASVPPPACVTKDEGADLGLVLIADGLTNIAQVCAPRLPANAFLRSPAGATYLAGLRGAADGRRATALSAFTRISAGHLPAGVTPELVMSSMASEQSRAAMSAFANDTACTEASRMIEALSPLPPANIATAISAMAGMALAVLPTFMAARRPTAGAATPVAASPLGPFCPA